MLRHATTRKVPLSLREVMDSLPTPAEIFSSAPYVEKVENLGDNVVEVVFKWVKMGVARRYVVRLRWRRAWGGMVYECLEPCKHRLIVKVLMKSSKENESVLYVRAEMNAGFMASLMGKKDFRDFVEKLADIITGKVVGKSAVTLAR